MNRSDSKVQAPTPIEELAIDAMAFTEALYEILVDKGLLTGPQVIERIKKMRSETRVNLRRTGIN